MVTMYCEPYAVRMQQEGEAHDLLKFDVLAVLVPYGDDEVRVHGGGLRR